LEREPTFTDQQQKQAIRFIIAYKPKSSEIIGLLIIIIIIRISYSKQACGDILLGGHLW